MADAKEAGKGRGAPAAAAAVGAAGSAKAVRGGHSTMTLLLYDDRCANAWQLTVEKTPPFRAMFAAVALTLAVGIAVGPSVVQSLGLGHYFYRPNYSTQWVKKLEDVLRYGAP